MTSPGDSSTPASSPPSITVCAPAPMALAISPDSWIPPSAQTGTPAFAAAFAQSKIAVICGMPAPATTRVVQIAPGPTPIFTPSAPAAMRPAVPAAVTSLRAGMRRTSSKARPSVPNLSSGVTPPSPGQVYRAGWAAWRPHLALLRLGAVRGVARDAEIPGAVHGHQVDAVVLVRDQAGH